MCLAGFEFNGLTDVRDLISSLLKCQLYNPGPEFNNAAIGSKPVRKCSAGKACSKGGQLKPSNQIYKFSNTKAFFAVNKSKHRNAYGARCLQRYNFKELQA